jgi:Fe-S cluster assembly ATP-binding protein
MLELKNISYEVDKKVILRNISFVFEKGLTYSILGNNGVGKSTFGKVIMGNTGYYKNHTGKIFFENVDITEKTITERAKLGITTAIQEPARFKGLSVKDYLTLGLKIKHSDEELVKFLEIVGLNISYLYRKVDKTLSGGERKRIELCSTIILKPKLIVLDEPDSGIDMMSNSMLKNIIDILKENGSTVITITHREEISVLADESLLLCGGTFTHSGKPWEINSVYKKICDDCNHINNPIKDKLSGVNK